MSWQDIVIGVGAWIFFFALLPSIFSKNKPALPTSIITGSVLASFVVAYASLSLWASAISTSFASAAWFILARQKYRENKNPKETPNNNN